MTRILLLSLVLGAAIISTGCDDAKYRAATAMTGGGDPDRGKAAIAIPPSREYRHTLSTLERGLVAHGFVIVHLSDDFGFTPDPGAEPGTWAHLLSIAPPWISFWMRYRPDVLP